MRLITDFNEQSKHPERLFAHIRLQVPERSGGELTNGGFKFVLFDQRQNRLAAGRSVVPAIPGMVLIPTASNLRLPVTTETKLIQLTVGFRPPSVRARVSLSLQKVRVRFPKLCDSICQLFPNERRWREKTYQITLPTGI
jgi:hypothetical protein